MAATPAIEALLEQTLRDLQSRRRLPDTTYRLQLHKQFTFRQAQELIPYLHELGITDIYTSPYLKARPGSMHGYDISDHRVFNPEIGTEADFEALVAALQQHGMSHVIDMVPNHMGIVGNENEWWNDVLENGPASPYSSYFDIDWHPVKPVLADKVLLPILGDPYGKVLEAQQIQLRYEAGHFTVHYFTHRFPVSPRCYSKIMAYRIPELEKVLGAESEPFQEYQSILTAIAHLPPRSETNPARVAERQREKEIVKKRLGRLTEESQPIREFIEQNLQAFNGAANDAKSFDLLDEVLNDEAYRLANWRVAADEVNYRRFFDINELAAISMEKLEVFLATHDLILKILREGKATGLRIDHPDGLYDPQQYLVRLQEYYVLACARRLWEAQPENKDKNWQEVEQPLLAEIRHRRQSDKNGPLSRPLYVVVEKILGRSEPLAETWPIHGTTGYGFLNRLNGVFVDFTHAKAFDRLYIRWSDMRTAYPDLLYQTKFLILQVSLSSELHMLAHQLDRLSEKDRWSRDFTLNSLRHALREIIACFPVYRSYIADGTVSPRDRQLVEKAVEAAKRKNPAISATLFDFVRDMLLLKYLPSATEADREEQRRFVGKFQQVTSPVMAKGMEDTSFYVYNRLVSLNEVGGDPDQFGVSPVKFHRSNQERQGNWAWALSTTATHDTKRGEDMRARLNVLSEVPDAWRKCLMRWSRINRKHQVQLEEGPVPDRNQEYFFYQTLLGAWPLRMDSDEGHAQFVQRIQDYAQKGIHEAKKHTSWINPNPPYDEAIRLFIEKVLDRHKNPVFLEDFATFCKQLSHHGLFNSLAQALLKYTVPGVPDTYQGTELWDFSLVDPDNRRPVDYNHRRQLLKDLKQAMADAGEDRRELTRQLTENKDDGRIKLYVTHLALQARRDHPTLFTAGQYLPIEIQGSRPTNAVGFVRRLPDRWAIVLVPRFTTQLCNVGTAPLGPDVWGDTVAVLPGVTPGQPCRNVFTGEMLTPSRQEDVSVVRLGEVFGHFPVALLIGTEATSSPP